MLCLTALFIFLAWATDGACPGSTNTTFCSTAVSSAVPNPSVTTCTANFFAKLSSSSVNDMIFTSCIPVAGELQCCADPCSSFPSASLCPSASCAPLRTAGGSGPAAPINCVSRDKLCWRLVTETSCKTFKFCQWSNSLCQFVVPTLSGGTGAPSVADVCPALHPAVVAMLALMFVSIVIAIVVVAVVVVVNQRKADKAALEEEERDHEGALGKL